MSNEWRPKEQIAEDLRTAFKLTAKTLEINREGKLGWDQLQELAPRVLKPMLVAIVCLLGPFFWLAHSNAAEHQSTLIEGAAAAIHRFTELMAVLTGSAESTESATRFGAIKYLLGTLFCGGLAAFFLTKVPLGLYFDLLERSVVKREGRIEGREQEVVVRRNDVIEYQFWMKDEHFVVGRKVFDAFDHGSAYALYLTPRSRVLVGMEPKELAGSPVPQPVTTTAPPAKPVETSVL